MKRQKFPKKRRPVVLSYTHVSALVVPCKIQLKKATQLPAQRHRDQATPPTLVLPNTCTTGNKSRDGSTTARIHMVVSFSPRCTIYIPPAPSYPHRRPEKNHKKTPPTRQKNEIASCEPASTLPAGHAMPLSLTPGVPRRRVRGDPSFFFEQPAPTAVLPKRATPPRPALVAVK